MKILLCTSLKTKQVRKTTEDNLRTIYINKLKSAYVSKFRGSIKTQLIHELFELKHKRDSYAIIIFILKHNNNFVKLVYHVSNIFKQVLQNA